MGSYLRWMLLAFFLGGMGAGESQHPEATIPFVGVPDLSNEYLAADLIEGKKELHWTSEALVTGHGDAFDKGQMISTRQLNGTGVRSVRDLAGSWIYLRSVFDLTDEEMEIDSDLADAYEKDGLVVITVAHKGSVSKSVARSPNHFVWLTELAWSSDSSSGPFLIGSSHPTFMIIDPAGIVSFGGSHFPHCTPIEFEDSVPSLAQWMTTPGIPISLSGVGSKLRRSIAKRDWKSAIAKTPDGGELAKRIDGILRVEIEWAESCMKMGDPLSAKLRLGYLEKLPKKSDHESKVRGIGSAISSNEKLKQIAKQQLEIVSVAGDLFSCQKFGTVKISKKDSKRLLKAVAKLEKSCTGAVPLRMLAKLRSRVEEQATMK